MNWRLILITAGLLAWFISLTCIYGGNYRVIFAGYAGGTSTCLVMVIALGLDGRRS